MNRQRSVRRRTLLAAVATGITGEAAARPGVESARHQESKEGGVAWRQFAADAANTGQQVNAVPVGLDGSELFRAPKPQWSVDEGVTPPVVADGRVYVATGDGTLLALGAGDGQRLWTAPLDAPAVGAPAVDAGTIVVNTEQTLAAFGAADGRRRWRVEMPSVWTPEDVARDPFEYRPYVVDTSHPVVADGTVYIAGGTLDDGPRGIVTAVDLASGAREWAVETSPWVPVTPAVADGTVVVPTRQGRVIALAATDGTRRWRRDLHADDRNPPAELQSAPAVADSTVYLGTVEGLRALALADGSDRWRVETPASKMLASPAVADGWVYATTTSPYLIEESRPAVLRVDAATGEVDWRTRADTEHARGLWHGPPAVADGVVYVGRSKQPVKSGGMGPELDLERKVVALTAADGERRWSWMGAVSTPAVGDGTVYAAAPSTVALGVRPSLLAWAAGALGLAGAGVVGILGGIVALLRRRSGTAAEDSNDSEDAD